MGEPLPSGATLQRIIAAHVAVQTEGILFGDPRTEAYDAVCDAYAEAYRLYCPQCRELLAVTMVVGDEYHFGAWCVECDWPEGVANA